MKAYHNIPAEMQAFNQWIVWRYETPIPNEKPTKVPYNPRNGNHASVKDASGWVTFAEACSAVEQNIGYDGIGFVFTLNDPFCGVDLDEADDEDGTIFERQKRIFEYLNSYSELSPSGNGLHVIVKASVPHGRKRSSIEIYSNERYFTFTGNVFRNAPIVDRQIEIQNIWGEMGVGAQPTHFAGDLIQREDDHAIIERAGAAVNGQLFAKLFSGDWSGYPPNRAGNASSEADFALIDIIAFYTKNRAQISRIFMSSGLAREKYQKRPALLGYMVNKSFDRMLPEVDLSAVIDKVNAAIAGSLGAVGVSLSPEATVGPAGAIHATAPGTAADMAHPDVTPSTFDGFDLTVWQRTPPPGLLGDIGRFIYTAAPRPVYEIALAGAIGVMAGICGRGYNASGTGLNHYVMLLANTGAGKEAIASGADKLIDAVAQRSPSARQVLGPSSIASGQALLKHLSEADSPCFVSIVGEIGLKLQQLSSPYANSSETVLKSVLLDLYNKSGASQSVKPSIYSDKKNNTKEIYSPAFSMMGESVPSEFYKAFDETAIQGGLLPRFLIIEYNGIRVPLNEAHNQAVVPQWLVENLDGIIVQNYKRMEKGEVINCLPDAQADTMLRTISDYADRKINGAGDADVLRQLWNRLHIKVFKLAALIAVGVNPYQPLITGPMVEWATSLVMTDIVRLSSKFERGLIGQDNQDADQEKAVRSVIRQYFERPWHELKGYHVEPKMHEFKVFSQSYLMSRLRTMAAFKKDKRGASQAVLATLKIMISNGHIVQLPGKQLEDNYSFGGTAYVTMDLKWVMGN